MKECDVAISATRTKWGCVDALKEYAEIEGVEIEWLPNHMSIISVGLRKICVIKRLPRFCIK